MMEPIEAIFADAAARRMIEEEDDAMEAMIASPPEPAKSGWDLVTSRPGAVGANGKPNLKVHQPEPEPAPPPKSPLDSPEWLYELGFDDAKLAAMMESMASLGMSIKDVFG